MLVSLSSVVTEVCDGFSLGFDWEFVEPESFSFLKKKGFVCLCGESKRNELRRDASKSASECQKKDEAAHATAKFTFIGGSKAVATGPGGTTKHLEHSGKNGR